MKKNLLRPLLLALMVLVGGSAWAGDKTVVKYSFDDAMSPSLNAGSRVSFDYDKTSVITSTKFLNAYNNTNGDPGSSTVSLGNTDLSGETWTLSFEWAACGGCNSKADHTTLKTGDTNLFDLTGNSNWNTTVTITYTGSDGTKTLPVPGCDKGKRFTAGTGDQYNTETYWHHIVVTGSASGVKMTITNSSTGTAVVEDVLLSETNVNPTSLIIEPCCGGAIGIDELSLTYFVEGEVIQTPTANYTAVNGIERTITATCDTEGATLYYSTDSENWTEGASITVSASGNVYFKAVKGNSESDVLTFAAVAGEAITLNAPTIVRSDNTTVTISADQTDLLLSPTATIKYTYGNETGEFTGSKTLTVAAEATITAYAEATGYTTSATSERAVALFPEYVNTVENTPTVTKGTTTFALSTETITVSEREYAALLLDGVQWGTNVYLQNLSINDPIVWGIRNGNWYINTTDPQWILIRNLKAGDIVVVDVTYPAADMVNATYSEKLSFGTKHAYIVNADGDVELDLRKINAKEMNYLYGVYGYSLMNETLVVAKEALQTAIAIATNINPEGLADAIAAAQAALTAEGATAESMAQAAQTLEAAIKTYFGEVLPKLGAIVTALNEETLNTAYADAQAALAKEDVTPQELVTAMQGIITAAQAVAPAHLQNLKGYAVKYGATDAVTLVDNALAAIEAGNVAQIIATMTAVKEAATPLAQTVLGTMKNYVETFGLTEQAAQAQAALEGGNYITMITTAKALFTHLIAAAKEYLPKLGAIAEGLNDETLNTAYAAAQELLAKESITPEELGAAMQNIITAAQAVAPAHLQNLRGYAVKYGTQEAVDKVDAALAAIEAGNVSQIIATMTAVKEAATPLATSILTQMIGYAESYNGFADDVTAAQTVLRGGNYITMITTAKALHDKLIAAAAEYVASAKAIPTEGKEGAGDLNTAIEAAEQALAGDGTDFSAINTAISNLVAAVKAFEDANYNPVYIETDLTAQFSALTDYTKWVGATGYTATGFCPAVPINDGTTKQVCEKYETTCNSTGDVFYQTVTGLTAGTYKIELYGGAAFTFGRGFSSEAFTNGEGDTNNDYSAGDHIDENTGMKLYATTSEGTYEKEIPIYYATNFPDGAATVVLEGVVIGANGEVKLGLNKTSKSTNWHVVQLKGVTAQVDAIELHANELAAAKAALNAEENAVVTGEEKTNLETAIEANATVAEHTADAYQAAIKALSDATAAFKAAKAAYEGYIAAQAYLVDLPYAKAEKKPVAEAAANATDAAAKAEALLIALRSYYESNALAEGVEGAKIATDSIKNANAEDGINNWTVVLGEGSGGNIDVKSNEPWTDAAGVAEHKYFDGGNWGANAWDVALEQKIALPAGKYLLTTIARAEKDVDFTLYAGVDSVKIAAISSVGGVFNRGWNNASVEFEMAEADSIVIGVRGVTSVVHNWMSFSDFRLVKFPSDEPVEPQYSGPVTVTWAMGETTTGVANPEANATAIAYTVGAGLTENGTSTYGDITLSKFDQNTGSDKGSNSHASATSLNKYVDFTFTPVGGDFTPTKVSFDVVKNGTGDPNIFVDVIDGKGATINVADNVTIVKNSETGETAHSFDVNGAASSDKAVTLRILFGKLASGKSVGIANVKIEGNLISASAPVFAATKEVTLKANPFRKTIETTITLTGKNLKNGTYQVPATNVPGLTIAPAEFTVAEGILNQELTLTYAPQEDVQKATDKLTFTVGELTAETAITYEARLTPLELAVVGEAKTWDWEKLTETIELNETTAPSKTDEFVFAELADQINFGEFDATSIMISNTVYPVRNKKFQNGTIKFETTVPGVITVDFSDTGSSGDNPAKRYLCINGEYQNLKTVDADNKLVAIEEEVYTQRDGSSDRKVSPTIYVAAGMVSINGWDPEGAVLDEAGTPTGAKGVNTAICIYKVTFTPKEGVDTGIMELNAEKNAQTIYNLSGQKLQKVQKGLYIINGKKTIVR